MLNRAMLIGRVSHAPLPFTQDGELHVELSVATIQTWRDPATLERRLKTEWHRVFVSNPALARFAVENIREGALVYCEGEIRGRSTVESAPPEHLEPGFVIGRFKSTLLLLSGRPHSFPAARLSEAAD